jgi:hypothetical protein
VINNCNDESDCCDIGEFFHRVSEFAAEASESAGGISPDDNQDLVSRPLRKLRN